MSERYIHLQPAVFDWNCDDQDELIAFLDGGSNESLAKACFDGVRDSRHAATYRFWFPVNAVSEHAENAQ